jgi:hypothetical protein
MKHVSTNPFVAHGIGIIPHLFISTNTQLTAVYASIGEGGLDFCATEVRGAYVETRLGQAL